MDLMELKLLGEVISGQIQNGGKPFRYFVNHRFFMKEIRSDVFLRCVVKEAVYAGQEELAIDTEIDDA